MNAIEAAERAGIDLSLADESLRLTPEQRLMQHEQAFEMALQLQSGFASRVSEPRDDRAVGRLLQTLCDSDLDFVVVGGFAAMLHGSSMLTRDLDVCAVLTESSIARLRVAFRDLHPVHRQSPQRLSFLDVPDPGVALRNVYLQTDLGPLDVLGSISGFDDIAEIRDNAVQFELFGRPIRVISRSDLIKAKEALGRPKDLLVAQELRAIAAKE